MSRIGRTPISIPSGVTVTISGREAVVHGPKGELKAVVPAGIKVDVVDNEVKVERTNDLKQTRAFHGLLRSLINNHIIGVTEGYKKNPQTSWYWISGAGQRRWHKSFSGPFAPG